MQHLGVYTTKYLNIESNTPTYPSGLGVIAIGNRLKCENAKRVPWNTKEFQRASKTGAVLISTNTHPGEKEPMEMGIGKET